MSADLACVVHVHSTFSDGTATVGEIVESARAAGADCVLLTDHDSLEARRRGLEGWHGDVLLLVGHEVSPWVGHYLVFGLDEEIDHRGMSEPEIAAAVRRGGAIGFAAHPFSDGSRMSRRIGRPHPWRALEGDDYTGIELWSLVTEAAEAWRTPLEAIGFMRRPEAAMAGPPARNLAAWDRICARRRCVAIGGLDAHQTGFRIRDRVISPFPNERFFRLLRTHVLWEGRTGDGAVDRERLYAALRRGSCYLGVDALGSPKGFRYWAEGPQGELAMGAEGRAGDWTLRAELPRTARVRLICDGREVLSLDGARTVSHSAHGAGVWRLEASLESGGRERTWIVSNPIYLRAGAEPASDNGSERGQGHPRDHGEADEGRRRGDLAA